MVFESSMATGNPHPNIVYIIADDLGYGDLSCLNPDSRIHTANLDRIAQGGTRFLNAHAAGAVCTPTRYSVLTGRYPWRNPCWLGGYWGYAPPMIPPARMTMASLLKAHGYHTACIGKWHLGLQWGTRGAGQTPCDSTVDFSKPVLGGPRALGFNSSYILPASLDIPPYVFIENEQVETLPTDQWPGSEGKSLMRAGPCPPGFDARAVLPRFTDRATAYIGERAKDDTPFFLYFALTAPHTPFAVNGAFQGRSGIGAYGDFVLELDACVGRVLDALDTHGMTDNTLVVLTSDHGPYPMASFEELAAHGHAPNHRFRGFKADIFEGGHRVPFLARWPGVTPPETASEALVCSTDLLATAADIVGAELPPDAGEDSVSMMPALRGDAAPVRETVVPVSVNGSLCICEDSWKLILCPDSGGWSDPRPETARDGSLPPVQLYNLDADIGETTNLWERKPEVVAGLRATLERYIAEGRSTPGPPQSNDGALDIWGFAGMPPGAEAL